MSQIPPTNPNVPVTPVAPAAVSDTSPHKPADDREEVYYEGTPLLRGHVWHVMLYSVLGILFILIPVFVSGYLKRHMPWWVSLVLVLIGLCLFVVPILIVKRTRFRITNYRIDFERGWLSTTIDTMELWHVEDIKFYQNLFERILGVGTIEIFSHDDTTPNLYMRGIPHARQLFTTLEQRIIAVKRQRGVLKVDAGT
jgi:membrane protein YdbS with pleckstrin-like domain